MEYIIDKLPKTRTQKIVFGIIVAAAIILIVAIIIGVTNIRSVKSTVETFTNIKNNPKYDYIDSWLNTL